MTTTYVFIDGRIGLSPELQRELDPSWAVMVLDPTLDGLEQMLQALQGQTGLQAIHVISHGEPGAVLIGSTRLDLQQAQGSAQALQEIGRSLAEDGDLLLYGCSVAAGTQGQALVELLARLTRADVAASVDDTGSATFGGNWQLEAFSGLLHATSIQAPDFLGLFAIRTGTSLADQLIGTSEDDTIQGLGGNDSLTGLAANDSIDGGSGNDSLDGGDGNDSLVGGAGNDTLLGQAGNDALSDSSGVNVLDGGSGADSLSVIDSRAATLLGGTGDDDLYVHFQGYYASISSDGDGRVSETFLLDGGADNDRLLVSGTTNFFDGGLSFLTLNGGSGDDRLEISEYFAGNPGTMAYATLNGGDGVDTLAAAGVLQVRMTGGAGSDTFALTARQFLTLQRGTVAIQTPTGAVQVAAQPVVIEDFSAGLGGDVLELSDLLRHAATSSGTNPFASGVLSLEQSGSDLVLKFDVDGQASNASAAVAVAVLKGVSLGSMTAANFSPSYPLNAAVLAGQILMGTSDPDSLVGGMWNDTQYGFDGDDTLSGLDGNDSIEGGDGADSLAGGLGNDTVLGQLGNDTLVDTGGTNLLDGGDGNDTLSGLSITGTYTLQGGAGNDQLMFAGLRGSVDGGTGSDTLTVNGLLEQQFVRAGQVTLNGNDGDDLLSASTYSEVLMMGGEGADRLVTESVRSATLLGGGGNDELNVIFQGYYASISSDGDGRVSESFVLDGGADDDRLTVRGGTNFFDGGLSFVTLRGGDGQDVLEIQEYFADNRGTTPYVELFGDQGHDTLIAGGALQVSLTGGEGADRFVLTAKQFETLQLGTVTIYSPTGSTQVTAQPVVINDLAVGAGGDVIDVVSLLATTSLAPTANPFASGVLRLEAAGSDTLLKFDPDGTAGTASAAVTAAVIKGVSPASITADNFYPPHSPNGSADTLAPTVTAFSPADEARGVALGANIVLTFNEPIQRGTGQIVLKTASGTTVATYDAAISTNLSISGNTLTLNPSADLSFMTGYSVVLGAGTVKDLAGNNYAGTSTYNFSTLVDPNTPALTPASLTNYATQVYWGVNQHVYEFVATPSGISLADAMAAASQKTLGGVQGHLVTLTSAAEDQFVYGAFGDRVSPDGEILLGASDEGAEGVWRWVAGPEIGQTFGYSNWGGAEPNDSGSGLPQDWLVYFPRTFNLNGKWADGWSAAVENLGYIVEYSGLTQAQAARTWPGDGRVVLPLESGMVNAPGALKYLPNGKVVLAGVQNTKFVVQQLNSDGSPDVGFGQAGRVDIATGAAYIGGGAVAYQADGKLLVVGSGDTSNLNWYDRVIVTRLNKDGSLDTSYGGTGQLILPVAERDVAFDVIVQADGKAVVVGHSYRSGGYDFTALRLNADGTLDSTFGTAGKVVLDLGSAEDYGFTVNQQPDGKLVLCGHVKVGGAWQYAVVRLNTNGSTDTSFGSAGKVLLDVGAGNDQAYRVVTQPDGKLLVAGTSGNGTASDFCVVRLNANGTLDTSFGSAGKVLVPIGYGSDPGSGTDQCFSLELMADGRIVLGGYSLWGGHGGAIGRQDLSVLRLLSTGALDTSFGSGGKVIIAGRQIDGGAAGGAGQVSLDVQPDGRVLIAGTGVATAGDPRASLNIVRLNVDGTLDTSFENAEPTLSPLSGHYYQYVPTGVGSPAAALSQAETYSYRGLQGYLVTISSAQENEFISSLLRYSTSRFNNVLSGTDQQTEGRWVFQSGPENGSVMTYLPWGPGEPNGYFGGYKEDYLITGSPDTTEALLWADAPNHPWDGLTGFIVEFGGLPASCAITPSVTTINEGGSVTFTIDTTNVEWGTVLSYTLSGISQADLTGGTLTGTVQVAPRDKDGRATLTVQLAADQLTEGTETLTLTVGGTSAAVTVLDTSVSTDTTPPTVTTFSPADEATSVAVGANIVLTFSEPIQRGTGQIVLKTSSGVTVATYDADNSANLSISGNTLTLNPSADLSFMTGYSVMLGSGTVKDLTGNNYAGTSTYNFSTQVDPNTPVLTPGDITDPTNQIFFNGHIYEFVPTPTGILWTQAQAQAALKSLKGVQGHMVTLTSAAEDQAVYAAFGSKVGLHQSIPLGASDVVEEGVWRWVAGPEIGQPLSYMNWGLGEPNNASSGVSTQDFLHYFDSSFNQPGKWDDIWNDATLWSGLTFGGYIVEYSGAADTTPPTVTTFSPADEATGVAVGANIVLTFSEAIQRGTGQIVLKTAAGATVATYDASTSTNLSLSGNTLTLNPSADLSAGTAYKVEFAAGSVKDLAGNAYAGTTAYNFSTQAAAAPGALQGMAYHWKSHVLLSGVSVSVSSAGAVQPDAGQLFDLRAAAFDAGSGALSVEVWVNPAAAFSNFDFAVATPGATAASFASALPAQWSVAAGTGNPQNVLVSGFSTAGAESGSVKLGTLQLTLPANGSGVQVAFSQIRVGDATGADQGLAMKTSVTGSDGRYSFTSLGAQDLMLSASRRTADSGNAISSADALAALRIAVGLNPNPDPDGTGPKTAPAISPYQIMAADVNGSGTVTSADALAILRMAVKLSTALPQEWWFVEETRDFWNEATQSFTLSRASAAWDRAIPVPAQGGTVNLVGVLKGDVNGSWAAPAGSTDLDVTDLTYFQRLAQLLGQPTQDQWGGGP